MTDLTPKGESGTKTTLSMLHFWFFFVSPPLVMSSPWFQMT